VKERWINFEKVGDYFSDRFGGRLLDFEKSHLHISEDKERIYNGDIVYDMAIDCTYGKLFPFDNSIFEVCITLVYSRNDDSDEMSPAVTIVDGEFFSIYPYKRSKSLYTLTHVKYTPMFQSANIDVAREFMRSVDNNTIESRRETIEEDVSKAYVNFINTHTYVSHFMSMKTKFQDVGCADRSTRTCSEGNVLSLCGGKITGACEVRECVTEFIEKRIQ